MKSKEFRKSMLVAVTICSLFISACEKDNDYLEKGATTSTFSVSKTKKIHFAKGNLQYQASTKIWRFAENQYDYIGEANQNVSSSYDGWIDLFRWGASGWSGSLMPFDTTHTACEYEFEATSLTGKFANADWGQYNAISNGGNKTGMWRTLSIDEWSYLLFERKNAMERLTITKVNDVPGLLVLPDKWTQPTNVPIVTMQELIDDENVNPAVYSIEQWNKLEDAGAVFLPAAGCRYGTQTESIGDCGYYWCNDYNKTSDTPSRSANIAAFDLPNGEIYAGFRGDVASPTLYAHGCNMACSVRLVLD